MKKAHSSKLVLQAAWLSILVNTLLFAGKYIAGVSTDSVALIADAWHTLSDSVSSIVLLIGIWFAHKPADKEHPFGHGRLELVITLFIGFILGIVALNFFRESYLRYVSQEQIEYSTFAILITVISLLAKEAIAQYCFYISKKSGSKALRADAWHHRSDAITSAIILLGIFMAPYVWWIDIALGFIVSGFILYTAIEIVWDTISGVIGEKADDELITEISTICNDILSKDAGMHHLHLHNYGIHKEVTFHIVLPNNMNIEEAHTITTSMEDTIREELGIEATIHIDPEEM